MLCGVNLSFERLSPRLRQVTYVLRTRAPLSSGASSQIPSDLHVLGLPLAFILSQDQTLHCIMCCLYPSPIKLNQQKLVKKIFSYIAPLLISSFFSSVSTTLQLLHCIISFSISFKNFFGIPVAGTLYVFAICIA